MPRLSTKNHHPDFQHHRLVLPVFELYVNRITQNAPFAAWLLSFNTMAARFLHVLVGSSCWFIFADVQIVTVWMYCSVCVSPAASGRLDRFHIWVIANILVLVFRYLCVHSTVKYGFSRGIAVPRSMCMSTFSSDAQTAQKHRDGPFGPRSHQQCCPSLLISKYCQSS